jgi:hypothetical protein
VTGLVGVITAGYGASKLQGNVKYFGDFIKFSLELSAALVRYKNVSLQTSWATLST